MARDVASTELAVVPADHTPHTVQLNSAQLRYIAGTEFVPPGLRNNEPAILACVATGRSLGIPDMTALRSIHIIDGKATFSAELMVLLVRRRGHSITGEVGDGIATVTGTRVDTGDEMTSTWTLAMAERAGLLGKGNWKKYPEAMLWARAVSQLCRMLFADCFAGGTHTPEEIEGGDVAEFEEISSSEPAAGDDGNVPVAGFDGSAEGPSGDETAAPLDAATPATEPRDPQSQPPSTDPPSASTAQLKKLNVLVGQLRDAKKITNEQLWRSTHREPVASEDGEVHWSPLRDSLSKDEASALIERLSKYAENLGVAA